MATKYRIAGEAVELCSCNAPCPCAFGQLPSRGFCEGFMTFSVREGRYGDVDLAGTIAVAVMRFPGVWTAGNWKLGVVLNANNSPAQREALQAIFSGQEGGDAATIGALIGEFLGFEVAPIEWTATDGKRSLRLGNLGEAEGEKLPGGGGQGTITVNNPNYPLPSVIAGKATKVRSKLPALSFEHSGSGMWVGPFEFKN